MSTQWWFGERRAGSWPESHHPRPVYRYRAPGVYVATLLVADSCGERRKIDIAVEVPEAPSLPHRLQIRASADRIAAGDVVAFDVIAQDVVLTGFEFEWDFGDDTPSDASASPTHVYVDEGLYATKVVVSDGCGDSRALAIEILVDGPGPPPVADPQWGRVPDAPPDQSIGTFDAAAESGFGLPQPVVCGLNEAVAGVIEEDGEHSEVDPEALRTGDVPLAEGAIGDRNPGSRPLQPARTRLQSSPSAHTPSPGP